jgi:hypothetical protein
MVSLSSEGTEGKNNNKTGVCSRESGSIIKQGQGYCPLARLTDDYLQDGQTFCIKGRKSWRVRKRQMKVDSDDPFSKWCQ